LEKGFEIPKIPNSLAKSPWHVVLEDISFRCSVLGNRTYLDFKMVTFEGIALEILGLGAVVGISFLVTMFVSITPYDYSASKEYNKGVFCAIPAGIYLAYRIYFGVCFYISSLLPKNLRQIGNVASFSSCKFSLIAPCILCSEWYVSTLLVSGGISASMFAPSVQPTLRALFDYYLGDVYEVVYKASEPEVVKAYGFGLRVLGLIAGWFVILFAVELLVRLVLLVVVTVLRAVGLMSKPKKEQLSGSKSEGVNSDASGDESASSAAK
jgi:hypothetical protein